MAIAKSVSTPGGFSRARNPETCRWYSRPNLSSSSTSRPPRPIVFTIAVDPVQLGLVASLSRPGGNTTGVNFLTAALEGKRLGLLRALLPGVQLIAVLLNPNRPDHADQTRQVQEAAATNSQQTHILLAGNESDIDAP